MSLLNKLMSFPVTDKIALGLGKHVQKSTVDKVALGISVIGAGVLGGLMAFSGLSGIGYDVGAGIFGLIALKYGYNTFFSPLTERDRVIRVTQDYKCLQTGETSERVVLAAIQQADRATVGRNNDQGGLKDIRDKKMHNSLKGNGEVILALMKVLPDCELQNTANNFINNRSFVLRLIQEVRGSLYSQLSDVLKKDPEVAKTAVEQGFGSAYCNMKEEDKRDKKLALDAIKTDYTVASEVVKYFGAENEDFCSDAILTAGKMATQDPVDKAVERPGQVVAEKVFVGDLKFLLKGIGKVATAYEEVMSRVVCNHAVSNKSVGIHPV